MSPTTLFVSSLGLAIAVAAVPLQVNTAFDYIIVGGGTSGLVVASRLSEDGNVTVAVIEAGDSVYANPNVTSAWGYGLAFGTDIDYAYQTVGQDYAGGKVQVMRAGKAIGGTSTINGMAYVRAQDAQINSWEALGNKGWNWESLLPYYKKSETIVPPTAAQGEAGYQYDPSQHGNTGPIKVGWGSNTANVSASLTVRETFDNLNVSTLLDVNDGNMNGFYQYPQTLDVAANIRNDAARAYYWPYADRTNLFIYTNTVANRIVWANTTGDATASGVSITAAGVDSVIYANKEVIVSGGALRSPAFLEHSGVGNPAILQAAGIDVVIDLPTVGENLQDQTNAGMSGIANVSISGSENYVIYPTAADIWGDEVEAIKADLLANLTAYAESTAATSNNVTKAVDLLKFFQMQFDLTFDGETPMVEIIINTGGGGISLSSWTLLPFSRGSIHINSADTSTPSTIDPDYFALKWDSLSQIQSFRYMRKILATAPLSSIVASETSPGSSVSAAQTDDEWFTYIKGAYRSNFHPVSTTAMMSKEIGGVVDSNLKVYGTSNVRVVDAGILPFQVCGHLTSTLYAVAEKAVDIIKAAA